MNNKYIEEVMKEANKAYQKGEMPVGAIIIKEDEIIAKAHNIKEKTNNPINHAEILAIKKACKKLDNWRLDGCKMIVTLQPCAMCASAIKQSRISEVIYFMNINDKKQESITNQIFELNDNNKKVIQEKYELLEYEKLWKKFFKSIRK